MPEQNITLIAAQEAERLCPEGAGRQATYKAAILANLRTWEILRAEDPRGTDWQLLEAQLARLDAEYHASDPYHHERIIQARSTAARLLERDGPAYVCLSTLRTRICYRFSFVGFSDPDSGRHDRRQVGLL